MIYLAFLFYKLFFLGSHTLNKHTQVVPLSFHEGVFVFPVATLRLLVPKLGVQLIYYLHVFEFLSPELLGS